MQVTEARRQFEKVLEQHSLNPPQVFTEALISLVVAVTRKDRENLRKLEKVQPRYFYPPKNNRLT